MKPKPMAYDDAEATVERHRDHIGPVRGRDLEPAAVLQPGLAVETQLDHAIKWGVGTVFIGGSNTWKRAYGQQIVTEAHNRGLDVHVGNPGGKDGLLWWASLGADSVDTSSIVQGRRWEWLATLEALTGPRGSPGLDTSASIATGQQRTMADYQ